MCRNIRPLFNMHPASSQDDVRASALQYVRKVSGYTRPSKANEAAFNEAVERIAAVTAELLESLTTTDHCSSKPNVPVSLDRRHESPRPNS